MILKFIFVLILKNSILSDVVYPGESLFQRSFVVHTNFTCSETRCWYSSSFMVLSSKCMVVSTLHACTPSCVTVEGLTITATADNRMTIYNEGVVVTTHDNWRHSTTVTIDDPCVLAIEGERHCSTRHRAWSIYNPIFLPLVHIRCSHCVCAKAVNSIHEFLFAW